MGVHFLNVLKFDYFLNVIAVLVSVLPYTIVSFVGFVTPIEGVTQRQPENVLLAILVVVTIVPAVIGLFQIVIKIA